MDTHAHTAPPEPPALRIKAIETILVEKGLIDPAAVDEMIDAFETRIGPRNGAKVVARAWIDPEYKTRLLADGTAAIKELSFSGLQGEDMVVLENTPKIHNVFVCTLCSCYPWPTLGLPPNWFKAAPYRARVVIEPRVVLAEFGLDVPDDVEVRVWDSNAELRYLVLPMRPAGTEGWTEAQLAEIVTRDSMIGTAIVADQGRHAMNGVHDLGGMHGLGPVDIEANEPVFHDAWEARTFAVMNLAGATGLYNVDELRHAIERMAPAEYLTTPYYVHWLHAMEDLMAAKGVTGTAEQVPLAPALPKDLVGPVVATGAAARVDVDAPPRFQTGDCVTAKNINPATHTRLPRYVRGKTGVVQGDHGGFVFADTRAHGQGDKPQRVYSVRFTARELWGPEASANDSLYIDLWDDYLDPATH